MRILFVLAYYHPYVGGAEYAFKGLAEELVRRGHVVRVITSQLTQTPATESISGVAVERVPVPRWGERYFFSALSLRYVLRRIGDYDLVHTASNNLSPPLLSLLRLYRRPVVFTCHEVIGRRWTLIEDASWRAWLYRIVERVNVGLPYDRHVAVSHATRRDLLGIGIQPERVAVVHNGIDGVSPGSLSPDGRLRSELGIGQDDFVYTFFGRPGKTKGIDYLLRAAPEIQRRIPNSHLVLFLATQPAGPYVDLLRLADSLGPGANVHVRPPVADRSRLRQYLLDSSCVVIPSLTEGFGLTTAETCALGVPVVATRAGSIPEVISGRYVLVTPGSVEALAEGVARAARGHYDEWKPPPDFSWQRMAAEYEAQYERLLG